MANNFLINSAFMLSLDCPAQIKTPGEHIENFSFLPSIIDLTAWQLNFQQVRMRNLYFDFSTFFIKDSKW